MRYLRVGPPGAERPVLHAGDTYRDLSGVTGDIDGAFLAGGGYRGDPAALPEADVSGQRLGPPIARPGVILCIGQNYAAHAAESGSAPPVEPIMFYKAPNTVAGPHDDILLPPGSRRTDWEVELGVVIGRRARYVSSPAEALAHVAGYLLVDDLSERDFQIERSGGQWSKGKSCESFAPIGPWRAPPDALDFPLRLRSWVNGEPRQDSVTADMIFDVAYLIWHLSQFTVLDPGDLISTGTPQGVALSGRFPYLRAGDVVEMEIDGLGRQRSLVREAAR
jgi:2-keto-4-pentenoate hydratase/2-oxohepta-3-ene-1,7-dioic acid hydratase in catechol pathway